MSNFGNNFDQNQIGALQANAVAAATQDSFGSQFDTSASPSLGGNALSPQLGQNSRGFGLNTNTLGLGVGAIQTLGSLWNSFQQNKLAKKSLNLQTQAYKTNLANQTQTYNTSLEDRIRTRYATQGNTTQEADSYIAKNKL